MSARGYAQAEHLSESIGYKVGTLTAQVGLANSHMIRGNLPAAQEELDRVLEEAEAEGLEPVRGLALHASASVAHSRGDYQRAVHLAYRSLELTTNPSARDRIMADIAAAYAGLGMRDTARDGYSIVAMTSPHQWVRWQATLNMMELAIQEGDESSFDGYVEQMKSASLDPKLRAYYLYFMALGSMRFHRQNAQALFDEAIRFAEDHQLNQIAFEIEAERTKEAISNPPAIEPTGELRQIAEVLEHLRESVSAG
jgi:tetratricopeptide (TPR) repeat protein